MNFCYQPRCCQPRCRHVSIAAFHDTLRVEKCPVNGKFSDEGCPAGGREGGRIFFHPQGILPSSKYPSTCKAFLIRKTIIAE